MVRNCYTDLVYDEFKEFEAFSEEVYNGYHHVFHFKNGFGASVIKHDFSYGNAADQFELAVLIRDDDGRWGITYDTPITGDVIGCLANDEVLELLAQIKAISNT